MRNLTISVPDSSYRLIRVYAAQLNTSVSALGARLIGEFPSFPDSFNLPEKVLARSKNTLTTDHWKGPAMRNITVSIPDNTYNRARVYAARHDTSVSAIVAHLLDKIPSFSAHFNQPERARTSPLAQAARNAIDNLVSEGLRLDKDKGAVKI